MADSNGKSKDLGDAPTPTLDMASGADARAADLKKQISEISSSELGEKMGELWNKSLNRSEQEALIFQAMQFIEQRGGEDDESIREESDADDEADDDEVEDEDLRDEGEDEAACEHAPEDASDDEADEEVFATPRKRTYGMFARHHPFRENRIMKDYLMKRDDSSSDEAEEELVIKRPRTARNASSETRRRTSRRRRLAESSDEDE